MLTDPGETGGQKAVSLIVGAQGGVARGRSAAKAILAVLPVLGVFLAGGAWAEENASNPLAPVNNVDLRWKLTSSDPGNTHDFFIDGSFMLLPQLKLKYELHYNVTNVTGAYEQGFESFSLKPIFFPTKGEIGDNWTIGTAIGGELSVDLGSTSKGIGTGAHQIAPLAGVALGNKNTGLTLVPLVQHFLSFSGSTDVNQTSARLIAIQPFGEVNWLKLDAKVPYDWENEAWPVSAEMQLGRNLSRRFAVYADGLVGIGAARRYDFGIGTGLRIKF